MERFVKGDIVVVPFPFSDLTQAKRRPALILAALSGPDRILCQITSQNIYDNYAVAIEDNDFTTGTLRKRSNVRPNRIFTCDIKIFLYQIGHLKRNKTKEIIGKVMEIINF